MMMRSIISAIKNIRVPVVGSSSINNVFNQATAKKSIVQTVIRNYNNNSILGRISTPCPLNNFSYMGLLQPKPLQLDSVRTVIKFSKGSGKRKTVHIVLNKFYRLNWGCWIHAKCGRHKKLYKKSANRRRRLQYHVFCNGRQNWLLDRMVTKYWRTPKYYVDDPYEPYHTRDEFITSRMKPYQPFS